LCHFFFESLNWPNMNQQWDGGSRNNIRAMDAPALSQFQKPMIDCSLLPD